MTGYHKQLKSIGILLCVSLCLSIIDIIWSSTYGKDMTVYALCTLIAHLHSILLVVYCLQHNNKKQLYFISVILYGVLSTLSFISDNCLDQFHIDTISKLCLTLFAISLAMIKMRRSRSITIVGTVSFFGYAAINLLFFVFSSSMVIISNIAVIIEGIALYKLWLIESGISLLPSKSVSICSTSIEDDLAALKRLHDDCVITDKEYAQKKNDILNNL